MTAAPRHAAAPGRIGQHLRRVLAERAARARRRPRLAVDHDRRAHAGHRPARRSSAAGRAHAALDDLRIGEHVGDSC